MGHRCEVSGDVYSADGTHGYLNHPSRPTTYSSGGAVAGPTSHRSTTDPSAVRERSQLTLAVREAETKASRLWRVGGVSPRHTAPATVGESRARPAAYLSHTHWSHTPTTTDTAEVRVRSITTDVAASTGFYEQFGVEKPKQLPRVEELPFAAARASTSCRRRAVAGPTPGDRSGPGPLSDEHRGRRRAGRTGRPVRPAKVSGP